jgi:PTS system nitrogen regulatory IIA component
MINSFLSSAEVILGLRAADKSAVIRDISRRASEALDVPEETIYTELLRREKLGSTGMGEGIALPHARLEQLKKPFGLAIRMQTPIDFEAIDGKPVDLVFALLAPASSEKEHISSLASIARKLRKKGVVQKLRAARDAQSFYDDLVSID